MTLAQASDPDPRPGTVPSGVDSGKLTPFVGRATELRTLRELIDHPSRSGGAIVSITGEAGIGKTRLMDEARRYATERGLACFSTRCEEVEREVPFALWTNLLRETLRACPRGAVRHAATPHFEALVKLLPELADRVWLIPRPGGRLRELGAADFLRQLCDYFTELAAEVPSLITIDDLALADQASLDLLRVLAQRVGSSPLRLFVTARDSQLGENLRLRDLLTALSGENRVTELTLGRLDTAEVGQLIAGVLVKPSVNPQFVAVISRKSEGNPFFVEGILASLIEQGAIVRSSTGWEGPPADEIRIPAGIRAVIHQRLLRLNEREVGVLRSASILGNSFHPDVVKRMLSLTDASLVESIDGALAAKLLREERDPAGALRYMFSHPLIGEVLQGDLSLLRREQLHLAAAGALAEGPGGHAPELAAALAYHYLRAGDTASGLDCSIRAGDHAAEIFARSEALDHYRTALKLFEALPLSTRHWEVQERLADQVLAAGDNLGASRLFEVAARGFIEQNEPVGAAECLVKQVASGHPHPKQAHDLLTQARDLLRGRPPGATLCRVQLQLTHLLYQEGCVAEARRIAQRNLELAVRLGLAPEEISACLELAKTLPASSRTEVRALIERALSIAETQRLDELIAKARGWGWAYFMQCEGKISTADQWEVPVLEANRKVANVGSELRWEGYGLAARLLFHGDFGAAAEAAQRVDEGSGSGLAAVRPNTLVVWAGAEVALGNQATAARLLAESKARLRAHPRWYVEVIDEFNRARYELNQDRLLPASRHLERARALGIRAGPTAWHAFFHGQVLVMLVRVDLLLGRIDAARDHLAQLERLAEELDTDHIRGFVLLARGEYSAATGDSAAARDDLLRSIDILGPLGWQYEVARAWEDVAAVFRQEGDLAASRDPQHRAEELYLTMGARPDLERLSHLARPQGP